MKKRLVLWGEDTRKDKKLIAVSLLEEENKVEIYIFPLEVATEEFAQLMMNEWRNERQVAFPEKYEKTEKELNLSDDLLPEGLTVDREDVLNRAQTEWNFIVMSSKMKNAFQSELEDIHSRIDRLDKFDNALWEEMKTFWDKVQEQIREKNLFGEHATSLRNSTDKAFDKMKALRRKMDEKYREESKEIMSKFMEELDEVEKKVKKGLGLKPLFEELKEIQQRFNKANLTRNDRSTIWPKLDGLFKEVKVKRFGDKSKKSGSQLGRLEKRYNGLENAIRKMERSIQKDKKDLEFENKRIKKTDGQLEQQIRQAKLKMIEERISSKENKLEDMHETRKMLQSKMDKAAAKEKEKEKEEEKKKAQKDAEAKIKEKIEAQKKVISKEEEDKLKKAADKVKEGKTPKKDTKADERSKDKESFADIIDTAAALSKISFEEE